MAVPHRTRAVPRPRNEKNKTRDRVDLKADPAWIEKVGEHADRIGLSLSAYIRLATSERMDRDDKAAAEANTPSAKK
ncbi:MAG: hypothetical protein JWO38_4868 [Gemmataceae bacterium]|nr:hypothetical protein [Gemmataceae bacterium]